MGRKKFSRAIGAVGLLLILAVMPWASGQSGGTVTVQLGPSTGQSVGVFSEPPDSWSGDASTSILPFGNYLGPLSGRLIQARTFLLFPLPAIPAGATATSAVVQVYVNDWPFDGSANLGLYRVIAAWDESLTWATQPANDSILRAQAAVSSRAGWVSWDVTPLLAAWRSGAPNYGVMLGGAPTPEAMAGNGWAAAAVGRTAGDAAHAPRLVVSYSLPVQVGPADVPEPGTALLLAGGLAALAGYLRLRRN